MNQTKKPRPYGLASAGLKITLKSEIRVILNIGNIRAFCYHCAALLFPPRVISFIPEFVKQFNRFNDSHWIYSIDANLHKTNKANCSELKEKRTWANNIIIGCWCWYSSCRIDYMEFSSLFARFPAFHWTRTMHITQTGFNE